MGEKWTKHEIDLVLEKGNRYYAIELKFPRNGEHPEQMFHFLKDIRFMEQVKDWAGFDGACAMTVTLDPLFHRAPHRKPTDLLYRIFLAVVLMLQMPGLA